MTDIYRIYHICMIHHSTSLSSQMLPSNWLGKTFSHWSFSHWSLVIGHLVFGWIKLLVILIIGHLSVSRPNVALKFMVKNLEKVPLCGGGVWRLMRKVFLRWEMATRVHLEAGLIAFV